jgi:acetyl esterase/lipase
LADIKDLFVFLSHDLNSSLDTAFESGSSRCPKFHVDGNAMAVAGSSAGGLCAYLAAMHAKPKPKAVVCMYAMGGHFLVCTLSQSPVFHL